MKVRDLPEEVRLDDVMPIERETAWDHDSPAWGGAQPAQSELSKLGGELKVRRGRWFPDPGRPGWYPAA